MGYGLLTTIRFTKAYIINPSPICPNDTAPCAACRAVVVLCLSRLSGAGFITISMVKQVVLRLRDLASIQIARAKPGDDIG